MKKGDQVVRTSIRSNEGSLGDQGEISRVFELDGKIFGYSVIWTINGKLNEQYVSPKRIQSYEAWELGLRQMAAAK